MSDVFDGLTKCLKCGKAIPCFSIEWSNLPDDQKCKCERPGVPFPPIDPVSLLLGVLLGNLILPLGSLVPPFGVRNPDKIRKDRKKQGRKNPHHPSAKARQQRRPDKKRKP